MIYFLKILFLSYFYTHLRARTHDPELKHHTLHWPSRPGSPGKQLIYSYLQYNLQSFSIPWVQFYHIHVVDIKYFSSIANLCFNQRTELFYELLKRVASRDINSFIFFFIQWIKDQLIHTMNQGSVAGTEVTTNRWTGQGLLALKAHSIVGKTSTLASAAMLSAGYSGGRGRGFQAKSTRWPKAGENV